MQEVDHFVERAGRKDLQIGVIGQGYVGLPLAVALTEVGFKVVGIDVDDGLVARLSGGKSHVGAVSDERLSRAINAGRLRFATRPVDAITTDAWLICVPTPVDDEKNPDLKYVGSAVESLRDVFEISGGKRLVVLESTVGPGTTAGIGDLLNEEFPDIHVAFSPERENPGVDDFDTKTTPRVVGADTPEALRMASALYSQLTTVHEVSSTMVAECAKLLENTYRLVNISLINELRESFNVLGIDIREVVKAASTKPFGFQAFMPGPGIGGHCIPVDPYYLTNELRANGLRSRIVEAAQHVNEDTPAYVVQAVINTMVARGYSFVETRLRIFGESYKKNVADTRESPAIEIIARLKELGLNVTVYDPLINAHEWDGPAGSETDPYLNYEIALILCDHDTVNWMRVGEEADMIFDTRGIMRNYGYFRNVAEI